MQIPHVNAEYGSTNGDGGKVLEISVAPDPKTPRGEIWGQDPVSIAGDRMDG
jgi:hypothetical protein